MKRKVELARLARRIIREAEPGLHYKPELIERMVQVVQNTPGLWVTMTPKERLTLRERCAEAFGRAVADSRLCDNYYMRIHRNDEVGNESDDKQYRYRRRIPKNQLATRRTTRKRDTTGSRETLERRRRHATDGNKGHHGAGHAHDQSSIGEADDSRGGVNADSTTTDGDG